MEERKKQVLNAIIKEYITSAEPVGSRSVAKRYDLGVSPATIRNEMSDLEEEGYIEQPHTSAGRIPSGKGYRYYVDNLMQREQLSPIQLLQVKEALVAETDEIDEFMRSCCNMISVLTNYTALASIPERSRSQLANIQLIGVNDYQVLVIMLASTGIIRHKMIEVAMPIKVAELANIEQLMRKNLVGKEIRHISYELLHQLLADFHLRERMAAQAHELLEHTLSHEGEHKIFTGGVMNMLSQPEFHDIDKLKNMFSLIEEEAKIEELLSSAGTDRLTVTIGGEMPVEGARDCSMVVANYFVNGEKAGSIGVLGPTRLNYGRTVSLMEFIAEELSSTMSDKEKNK
jgi:heat-inducible transcriptional repressor